MSRPITASLIGAAALATLAACGSTAKPAAAPSVPCGVSTLGRVSVRRFCGTGTVTIHSGRTTAALTQAECTFDGGSVTVNGGVLVLGHATGAAGLLSYVGVNATPAAAAPGATTAPPYRGLVSADVQGRVISVTGAAVAVAADRTSGNAQGLGRDGAAVAVTFSC